MLCGPGDWKSAIVYELVHTNLDGQVLTYYCCQADTPATLDAARFVRSVAGMLAARLKEYAAVLENHDLQRALSEDGKRGRGDPGAQQPRLFLIASSCRRDQ